MRSGADAADVLSRQLAALLCRDLARGAPEVATRHASQLVPLAWIGSHDEDKEVATLFESCWEEATSSGCEELGDGWGWVEWVRVGVHTSSSASLSRSTSHRYARA